MSEKYQTEEPGELEVWTGAAVIVLAMLGVCVAALFVFGFVAETVAGAM